MLWRRDAGLSYLFSSEEPVISGTVVQCPWKIFEDPCIPDTVIQCPWKIFEDSSPWQDLRMMVSVLKIIIDLERIGEPSP